MKGRGLILLGLLVASQACQAAKVASPPTETAPATTAVSTTATPTLVATLGLAATAEGDEAPIPEFIVNDLLLAGYSTDQGELAWMQPEELALSIENTELNKVGGNFLFEPLQPGFTAANFVFGADVEWDFEALHSTYGWSTCGVIFRAGDVADGEQGQFNIIFINPDAYPSWDVELWNNGQYQSTFGDLLHVSSDIKQVPGGTNHFVIAADGGNATVFANGTLLGTTPLDASLTEGEFGLLAGSLHGSKWYEAPASVTCTLTNTWIWELP